MAATVAYFANVSIAATAAKVANASNAKQPSIILFPLLMLYF